MRFLEFTEHDLRLTVGLARMSVRDRYLGSSLGMAWAILNPLLMMGLFTFVFGFIFKSRLPGSETTLAYSIWLISGYGPWLSISEALLMTATSVRGGRSLVKNIAFNVECLPLATSLAALFTLSVILVFLLVLVAINGFSGWPALIWLPAIIIMQLILVSGIGLGLSAFNVFFPDIGVILPNILLMILFASPIFYPVSAMPWIIQAVTDHNPFYLLVESYRAVLQRGESPNIASLIELAIISGVVFLTGLWVFRRLKPYFDGAL